VKHVVWEVTVKESYAPVFRDANLGTAIGRSSWQTVDDTMQLPSKNEFMRILVRFATLCSSNQTYESKNSNLSVLLHGLWNDT